MRRRQETTLVSEGKADCWVGFGGEGPGGRETGTSEPTRGYYYYYYGRRG